MSKHRRSQRLETVNQPNKRTTAKKPTSSTSLTGSQTSRGRNVREVKAAVNREVERVRPRPVEWTFDPFSWYGGRGFGSDGLLAAPACPACKCPDYRQRASDAHRRPREPFRLLGVITSFPHVWWECAHCEADRKFLEGPTMWGALLELRESVLVDDLTYEEFCTKELELFERYMSAEDIEFSDRMVELSRAATFEVSYDGQPRSLRTGLLIRRFQIKQWLQSNARRVSGLQVPPWFGTADQKHQASDRSDD